MDILQWSGKRCRRRSQLKWYLRRGLSSKRKQKSSAFHFCTAPSNAELESCGGESAICKTLANPVAAVDLIRILVVETYVNGCMKGIVLVDE